jgi:hypothetical protein
MYHIWYIMVVNFYIVWICITYDTTCLLTTSQWRPLHCIISVTPQQCRDRTIPLKNIWKYVYCIVYGTKCSEGLKKTAIVMLRVLVTVRYLVDRATGHLGLFIPCYYLNNYRELQ